MKEFTRENNIGKLEKLTEQLPALSDITLEKTLGKIEWKVDNGTAVSYNLYNDGDVGVCRSFLSAGSRFPKHSHDVHEWGIIYSGSVKVIIGEDEMKKFCVCDMLYFPPHITHYFEALEDTWIVFITVPADRGYPNDGGQ